jgi:uncharacterized protein
MPTNQGRFVWNELATTDADAAIRFYTALLPWSTKPWDEDGGYTLIENQGIAIGGIAPIAPGGPRPPGWTPSVYVYDIDACARQVPRIGGTVLRPPEEIPNMGCWALIAGPDGAPISIYEPADTPKPPRDGRTAVGDFSWYELLSTDWKASWEFYRQLVGWERVNEHDMDRLGTYFEFGLRGKPLGGMFTRNPDMPPPNWTSYIECRSVTEAAQRIPALGGKVMRSPSEVPGGTWITICSDPQGVMFALTSSAS